jgi:hypothetical protein
MSLTKKAKDWWNHTSKGIKIILCVVLLVIGAGVVTILDNNQRLDDIVNPNHAPEIVYAYPGMPTVTNILDSSFLSSDTKLIQLRAGIVDKDGDKLTVTFWIHSSSTPWKGVALFEGYNNTYVFNLNPSYLITYLSANKYEWRIDASDGKDAVSKTFPMYII